MLGIDVSETRQQLLDAIFPSWIAELSNLQILLGALFILLSIYAIAFFAGKLYRKTLPKASGTIILFVIICVLLTAAGT